MSLEIIEQPPGEPVSVAEAKVYLRIETDEEDATLAALLRVARELCEAFIGQGLVEAGFRERLWACSARLQVGPVRTVMQVARVDALGDLTVLEASAWHFDPVGERLCIHVPLAAAESFAVDYRAGMAGDWNGVPEPLRLGVLRLAAHLFVHRDKADDVGPPAAVAALWQPWRRLRLR